MKKSLKFWIVLLIIFFFLIGIFYLGVFDKITGKIISSQNENNQIGPSAEEQSCMMACMKCTSPGVGCTGNQQQCTAQCNVQKPETTEETSCMEECVIIGCGEFDFACQETNKDKCEEECDMFGDKPDESEMSAEQLCISKCVAEVDPNIICGASQEGETGGEVCQKCAQQCVNLYEGPCLDDEKLKSEQKKCETCEHCYGEPIMGDSGEGWECIVDVECKDSSGDFGDDSGTGPGIEQDGFVAKVGDTLGNIFEGIGNFFKGIFGGEKEITSQDSENSNELNQ